MKNYNKYGSSDTNANSSFQVERQGNNQTTASHNSSRVRFIGVAVLVIVATAMLFSKNNVMKTTIRKSISQQNEPVFEENRVSASDFFPTEEPVRVPTQDPMDPHELLPESNEKSVSEAEFFPTEEPVRVPTQDPMDPHELLPESNEKSVSEAEFFPTEEPVRVPTQDPMDPHELLPESNEK